MLEQPIRVLQIIGIVCGGGVEAVIMNYYRKIDRNKVQFDFIVDGYERTALDDEIENLGGKIYHITAYKINIFRYMRDVYRVVRMGNYKIVHSNMNTMSLFSLFAAYLAGAEVRILHNHSSATMREGMRSVLKYVLRPMAPCFANVYLACSQLAGRWMYGAAKMRGGAVSVIYNAIDLQRFSYDAEMRRRLREAMGISESDFIIGHIGRFAYQKNHAFLIRVFENVVKKRKDALLVLIGEGELLPHIKSCVQSAGLEDCVRFLGLRNDVSDLYNIMDVFLLPSWYEGLPVVAVEAQANGLSCIFSDCVTDEARLTSHAMFLPLEQGPEQWADVIQSMDVSRNADALQELRQAGFDLDVQARALEHLYCSCYETLCEKT